MNQKYVFVNKYLTMTTKTLQKISQKQKNINVNIWRKIKISIKYDYSFLSYNLIKK